MPKWFLTFLGSLLLLGVSSFASVLHHRVSAFESRLNDMERLMARQAEQLTHATNVIRRLYEHQEELDAVITQLKERVGKVESAHELGVRGTPHAH